MMDNYYDELSHASTETTSETTFGETRDLFYKFEKDEGQLFSDMRSEGNTRKLVRDEKISNLISSMNKHDKKKYSFVPDPDSLKRLFGTSSPLTQKKYYDYDKIAIDNDFLTDSQFNKIDQENSKKIRKLIEKNRMDGGSTLAMFTGSLLAHLNPLNAPENFIPFANWRSVATILGRALKVGAESAILQTVIEPQIHKWKDEINSPYELKDSIENVALTGVFGAGVSGLLSGVEHVIKNVKLGKTDKKILQDFVDDIKENPFRDEAIAKAKEKEVVPEVLSPSEKISKVDVDLEIVKEIEDFYTRLNETKEPEVKPILEVPKESPKERIDVIESESKTDSLESKDIKPGDSKGIVDKSFEVKGDKKIGSDESLETIVSLFADVNEKVEIKSSGKIHTGRLTSVIPDEDGYTIYVKQNRKPEIKIRKDDIQSIKSVGKYEPHNKYSDIEQRNRMTAMEGLENAILEPKIKKAGDSKGVDKKVSKIDDLSLAKDKKPAKIRELKTIIDDSLVPLQKVIDDTDVEIETYKGLKDCIL